eukprot:COSAG04_NODE_1573_length_6283_cov_3.394405_4_plen_111_part_00
MEHTSLPVLSADAEPEWTVHYGDLAYNLELMQGMHGDRFLRDIEPLAATRPYMVCAGNHERLTNFSHLRSRFDMPGKEAGQENYFWSRDISYAHLVFINTVSDEILRSAH